MEEPDITKYASLLNPVLDHVELISDFLRQHKINNNDEDNVSTLKVLQNNIMSDRKIIDMKTAQGIMKDLSKAVRYDI